MTLDLLPLPRLDQPDLPQQTAPMSTSYASNPLSTNPAQPLTWLWPQRIPSGKLTLLDGSPGCGTFLFTLNLAACVSAGLPLTDGTPGIQGSVLLIAPHDSFRDTIKPRLQAAGANLDRIMTLSTVPGSTPRTSRKNHLFSLPQDLALLESIITSRGVVLFQQRRTKRRLICRNSQRSSRSAFQFSRIRGAGRG